MNMLISREELDFQLFELQKAQSLQSFPRYAEHDQAVCESILDIAYKMAEEEFLPHAAKLDSNEPTFDGDDVHIIPEVKIALEAYQGAGFFGASFDEAEGGLQLPWVVNQAVNAIFASANIGTLGYAVLTVAAANMLKAFGSEEQKAAYLSPMVEGDCYGTMCLSEPHAGSSLSDITTKATLHSDGSYRIQGTKMWISAGEHDLSENIVHMVLARIPNSPPGVGGISLFLVPKLLPDEAGKLAANGVRLAGLNHKMGWRGTVNTVLNFGENDDCKGFLIGEPNRGLNYMFHMLNEARIAVGLESVALAAAGYAVSLDYATTRTQGRHPGEKDASAPAVPIIEHADIRRMLYQQKSYIEGALGLLLYCAKLIDLERVIEDDALKEELSLLLDLLTPIAKGWPSEFCPIANKNAIQILGGYGYTRDFPVERLYRDNRLNAIHDGTTAMQAMDLLGRKVLVKNGRALELLVEKIRESIAVAEINDSLKGFCSALESALNDMLSTTEILRQAAEAAQSKLFLANATLYLEAVGHVVVAWMWLKQGHLATDCLASEGINKPDFYNGKLAAMRYFFRYELPHTRAHFALLRELDDTCVGSEIAGF